MSLEDLDENTTALGEELDAVSDDLADVEEIVYGDDEDECGCGCEDEDFFEVECPNCGEDLEIDESVLETGSVECPNCGEKFAIDLSDEDDGCGCGCDHDHGEDK